MNVFMKVMTIMASDLVVNALEIGAIRRFVISAINGIRQPGDG
jgi:hypothetical protein